MSLAEIEFELSAHQFELMGYPPLKQGESLSLVLDAGILFPDPGADSWFTVQKEPVPPQFCLFGPAQVAFAGQIVDADLFKEEDEPQAGVVVVDCGDVLVRVTCAPQEDGRLPWGTWETRYLIGAGHLQGLVEEEYQSSVGRPQGVTIWRFRRLVLRPGDPLFGQWHETVDLLPQPYRYDRIYVTARVHRGRL
jgi:hypothetical protein